MALLVLLAGCGEPDFETGRRLLREERWEEAAAHWRDLLKDHGAGLPPAERLEAEMALADASEECGRVEDCISALEEAQKIDPHDPHLLQRLFTYYGRYAPAGGASLSRNRVLRAVERLEDMAATEDRGDGEEGRKLAELLGRAVAEEVDRAHANYGLGLLACLEPTDMRKAGAAFARAVDEDPGHERARLRLAWVLSKDGRKERALEILRTGWRRGERSAPLCLALANWLPPDERDLRIDALLDLHRAAPETHDELLAAWKKDGAPWLAELLAERERRERQQKTLERVQILASANNDVPVIRRPAPAKPGKSAATRTRSASVSPPAGGGSAVTFLPATRKSSGDAKSGEGQRGRTVFPKNFSDGRAPDTKQLRIFRFGH